VIKIHIPIQTYKPTLGLLKGSHPVLTDKGANQFSQFVHKCVEKTAKNTEI